jgi:hypothetical protein
MSKICQRFSIVAVISLLGLAAIGCMGSAAIEHLEASPNKVSLAVNTTQQLAIALVASMNETDVTARCTYQSNATVSTDGLVTGVKPGSTKITVSYTKGVSRGGANIVRTVDVPVEVK